MKKIALLVFACLLLQPLMAQKVDMEKAPRNPMGFKYKKEHFNLKGDIYASGGKIFDRNGNMVYNFGTRYYYENGKIIGNNYNDTFKYDSRGNITEFSYVSGSTSNYEYNNDGLLTYEKNSYGDEKEHSYDNKGRLIKSVVKRKGNLYQTREFSYSKENGNVVVAAQYYDKNNVPGFKGIYHYKNGNLVKEVLTSGTYNYVVETDSKGNKSNFYSTEANARKYPTFNRYYSDANKPMEIKFGYYMPGGIKDGKKMEAVYVNGEHAKDFAISKGMKPNEKVVYDGLTQTYYAVSGVMPDTQTLQTRLPVTQVLLKGKPYMNYAYDGKFINYIDGYNRVKHREFSFLGPHMIDYREDKNVGRTYIIRNYKNIKHKAIKDVELLSATPESIFYLRDLEKDNFFIVVNGKHIDYKKARFEYLTNGDPVIFLDDKPEYVLTGFKTARANEVLRGKVYNNELNTKGTQANNNSTNNSSTTNTNSNADNNSASNGDYNCSIGDCKNGWGRVEIGNIITDATFKDGAIEGVAYITYPNGSYYHGEYVKNRREGFGYYKWSSGNIYVGEWKDGKQNGWGYTTNSTGNIVSAGVFENGKLKTSYGDDYKNGKRNGNCIGNCSTGFGKFTYSNGDVFIGFFNNGKRSHVGTYRWSNKSAYTGAYTTDGKRNGYGIYTYVDGSIFKGIFVDDRINGLGMMNYAKSGNTVKGVFNNKGAKVKDY